MPSFLPLSWLRLWLLFDFLCELHFFLWGWKKLLTAEVSLFCNQELKLGKAIVFCWVYAGDCIVVQGLLSFRNLDCIQRFVLDRHGWLLWLQCVGLHVDLGSLLLKVESLVLLEPQLLWKHFWHLHYRGRKSVLINLLEELVEVASFLHTRRRARRASLRASVWSLPALLLRV